MGHDHQPSCDSTPGHAHSHQHHRPSGHGPSHAHHGHDHGHGRSFLLSIGLNSLFTFIAVIGGLWAHSVSLLADAVHNLGDILGLVLAWGAARLARRQPSLRRTYGLRSTTILAALTNAVLLLVVVGGVAWEAILRLQTPEPVQGLLVLAVAAVGVVTNGLSALLFLKDRKHDANVRGAFLHLAADAGVSLAVVLTGALLWATGWTWIDPVMSLIVSAVILVGTWSLLRESLDLALGAVPDHIDPEAVRRYLTELPGVTEVHDLHIWAMSTTETALTAHLVMPSNSCAAHFLGNVCQELHQRFRIDHPTLQVEPTDAPDRCRQAAAEAV